MSADHKAPLASGPTRCALRSGHAGPCLPVKTSDPTALLGECSLLGDRQQADTERLRRATEAMQQDTAALLRALGLSDHARPESCHAIIRGEIEQGILQLRADLAAARSLLREAERDTEPVAFMVLLHVRRGGAANVPYRFYYGNRETAELEADRKVETIPDASFTQVVPLYARAALPSETPAETPAETLERIRYAVESAQHRQFIAVGIDIADMQQMLECFETSPTSGVTHG